MQRFRIGGPRRSLLQLLLAIPTWLITTRPTPLCSRCYLPILSDIDGARLAHEYRITDYSRVIQTCDRDPLERGCQVVELLVSHEGEC